MPSRRTLRTAIRAFSAYWPTSLANSLRRSSVSSGIGSRDALAGKNLGEVSWLADVEHDDRDVVVATQCDRGGVHHLEVVAQHLAEGDLIVAGGACDLLRVGGVDAVNAGALEQSVAAHLRRAQCRCRIGG